MTTDARAGKAEQLPILGTDPFSIVRDFLKIIPVFLTVLVCSCASYDQAAVKRSINAIERGSQPQRAWKVLRRNEKLADAGFAIEVHALLFRSMIEFPQKYAAALDFRKAEDKQIVEYVLERGHLAYETFHGTNDLPNWEAQVGNARRVFSLLASK